nr:hypothetical protein Iba_chr02aCG14590 [Ipomoea batatas]
MHSASPVWFIPKSAGRKIISGTRNRSFVKLNSFFVKSTFDTSILFRLSGSSLFFPCSTLFWVSVA